MVEYAAVPLSVKKSTPRMGKEAYLIPKPEILEYSKPACPPGNSLAFFFALQSMPNSSLSIELAPLSD